LITHRIYLSWPGAGLVDSISYASIKTTGVFCMKGGPHGATAEGGAGGRREKRRD